jgi:hypothetical protein
MVRWPSSVTSSESGDRAPGPDRISALDQGPFCTFAWLIYNFISLGGLFVKV